MNEKRTRELMDELCFRISSDMELPYLKRADLIDMLIEIEKEIFDFAEIIDFA